MIYFYILKNLLSYIDYSIKNTIKLRFIDNHRQGGCISVNLIIIPYGIIPFSSNKLS